LIFLLIFIFLTYYVKTKKKGLNASKHLTPRLLQCINHQANQSRQLKYKDNNSNFQAQQNARLTAKPEQGKRGFGEALGTNAKSSAIFNDNSPISKGLQSKNAVTIFEHIDESTGEVNGFLKTESNELIQAIDSDRLISEKYMLLSSVRSLMPLSRTAKCNRLSRGCDITVMKNIEFNSVNFSGVQTCGSPWACPWCSSKISERRKNEVVKALEMQLAQKKTFIFFNANFFAH
jgi:hypothetical protein